MILRQNLILEVACSAADAKMAEGASEVTRLTPKPPFLTGRLAWIHWMSESSVFDIVHTPFLRRLSNLSSIGFSAQDDDLSVCINFGALNDALISNSASCAATRPSLSMDLDRSSHRLSSAVSIDLPFVKGAPRRVASVVSTWMKNWKTGLHESPSLQMSSHFLLLR